MAGPKLIACAHCGSSDKFAVGLQVTATPPTWVIACQGCDDGKKAGVILDGDTTDVLMEQNRQAQALKN